MTLQIQLWILGGIGVVALFGISSELRKIREEMEGLRLQLKEVHDALSWIPGNLRNIAESAEREKK